MTVSQVKIEQRLLSEPPKRVLTPAAGAAKHRRAKDKKQRETACWWFATGRRCPNGDHCTWCVTSQSSHGTKRKRFPKDLTRGSWVKG